MEKKLWMLELTVPALAYERALALLVEEATFGWQENELENGAIILAIHAEDRSQLAGIAVAARKIDALIEAKITEVANKDWQLAWREYFTPVEAGSRFVILPPWLAHLAHTKRQEIIIEPKNAFGTGHHASTVLCLEALSDLIERKRLGKRAWFLDLGCGSGILGIAACKCGLSGTGLDIDPVAIANSRENRELNEATNLELLKGGLGKIGNEKFDLIMANILAQPLIEMAPKIASALKKDGCLILGGILDTQADAVAQAYIDCGLGEPRQLARDEWRALVWE